MAKVGRPLGIETPQEMWELFQEYEKWCKENPIKAQDYVGKDAIEVYRLKERPLTIVGFASWLFKQGIVKGIDQYFSNQNGNYDQFLEITAHIKNIIVADQVSGGMAGIYNSNLTARLTGLADKKEVENSGNIQINVPKEDAGLGE